MITAPAAFSAVVMGASTVTGSALVSRLPRRVGRPEMSMRSLMVTGTPSSTPSGVPAAQRTVLARAACKACGFIAANALMVGFSAAMRSVTASRASSGERLLFL